MVSMIDCIQMAINKGHNKADYSGEWLAFDTHHPEDSMPNIYNTMVQMFGYGCNIDGWLSENTHITFIKRHTYRDIFDHVEDGEAIVWYKDQPLAILEIEQRHDGKDYHCYINHSVFASLLMDYSLLFDCQFDNGSVKDAWSETESFDPDLLSELSR